MGKSAMVKFLTNAAGASLTMPSRAAYGRT